MDDPIILNIDTFTDAVAIDLRKLAAVTRTKHGVMFYVEGLPASISLNTPNEEECEGLYKDVHNLALRKLSEISSDGPVMFSVAWENLASAAESWSVDLRRLVAVIQNERGLVCYLKGCPESVGIPAPSPEYASHLYNRLLQTIHERFGGT